MRGSSIKRLPYGPDAPGPQPAVYPPLVPSGHAVLAEEIVRAAGRASCPAERLRGLCEAYVNIAGLSTLIRDGHDVARVVEQAQQDFAGWQAATLAVGAPDLTYYLRLTQQQEDAERGMEELTRLRGRALAEYQRETGASLREVAALVRLQGYAISASGVAWLTANSAPH
jgi:hypothetical protein